MNEKWLKRYETVEQATDKILNLLADFPYTAAAITVAVVLFGIWMLV